MRQGSLAVSHTRDVVLALERIISLAKDAETGQRGYLITGEERYLAPYRSAVGAIGDQLKFLEDLTANSALHSRLPALKAGIETRMAIRRGSHRIAPEPRFLPSPASSSLTTAVKREMDALRGQVDEMIALSEEKFRRQAEELDGQLIASGRLVSVSEVTASMAHESNNPLGIILGFAEEVRGELSVDESPRPRDHRTRNLPLSQNHLGSAPVTCPIGPEPA